MTRTSRRTLGLVLGAGVILFFLGAVWQRQPHRTESGVSPATTERGPSHLMVLTYFYYWYDAATGLHLSPSDPLPTHPVSAPQPSWHNVAWYEKELSDMAYAGIDVVLPVYWGFSNEEPWSAGGLQYLVEARRGLVRAGRPAPLVGMFFDTTILTGLDLTRDQNIRFFYANVKDFFSRIPEQDWALVRSRPVIWLFLPQDNVFDQRVFDFVYRHFEQDFGVRPYIVRDTGWDCAMRRGFLGLGPPKQDCSELIRTDASYAWGAAQNGFQETYTAATVGPGYDERQIPGRSGVYRPRESGEWYRTNLCLALASGRKLLAIETWNEFHEASGIADTVEYGRTYIDMTRALLAPFKGRGTTASGPAGGSTADCPVG